MGFLGRIALLCCLFCFGMYGVKARGPKGVFFALYWASMALWIAETVYLTVLSRSSVLDVRYQLVPFEGYVWGDWYGFLENALLFMPFGFLLCLCDRLRGRGALLAGMAFSLGIELLQLVSHRGICDINDWIANFSGVCVAVGLWKGMEMCFGRKKDEGDSNPPAKNVSGE